MIGNGGVMVTESTTYTQQDLTDNSIVDFMDAARQLKIFGAWAPLRTM